MNLLTLHNSLLCMEHPAPRGRKIKNLANKSTPIIYWYEGKFSVLKKISQIDEIQKFLPEPVKRFKRISARLIRFWCYIFCLESNISEMEKGMFDEEIKIYKPVYRKLSC